MYLQRQMNKNFNEWVKRPLVNKPVVNQSQSSGQSTMQPMVNRPLHKRKKETTKDITPATANAVGDINPIFNIFEKTINPTINYGNTTQRKAIQTLIEKVGLERTIAATKYAISIQTDRYAPTITTPIQLLNKYGELQAYYQKHKQSKINQSKTIIL